MRIELKPDTIERIESITGKRMTTRCDRLINEALNHTECKNRENFRPQVILDPKIREALQDE